MRQPVRPDDAETDLRLCYTGPSPARPWQEAFEQRFGLRVVCGYAMSESPYGLIWRHGERPFGTLGSPRQHPTLGTVNEARVVDDNGRDVATGEVGELLLRNPTVTPGYWQMPEETEATVVRGWLHTGDLVTADPDGNYTFVSRVKEVLRRRGLNLSPTEVEEAIAAHPDVLEVAVVGGALGADRGRGQGLRRRGTRPQPRLRTAAGVDRRTALRVCPPDGATAWTNLPYLLDVGTSCGKEISSSNSTAPWTVSPSSRATR